MGICYCVFCTYGIWHKQALIKGHRSKVAQSPMEDCKVLSIYRMGGVFFGKVNISYGFLKSIVRLWSLEKLHAKFMHSLCKVDKRGSPSPLVDLYFHMTLAHCLINLYFSIDLIYVWLSNVTLVSNLCLKILETLAHTSEYFF